VIGSLDCHAPALRRLSDIRGTDSPVVRTACLRRRISFPSRRADDASADRDALHRPSLNRGSADTLSSVHRRGFRVLDQHREDRRRDRAVSPDDEG